MPVIEEFAFRSWLGTKNKKYLIIGLGSFCLLLLANLKLSMAITLIAFAGIILWFYFQSNTKSTFLILILISSISFALPHIKQNFTHLNSIGLLSYFIGIGLFLAHIRLKHGLKWSIGVHYLYNFVLLLISIVVGGMFPLKTKTNQIANDCFNGTITTHGVFDFEWYGTTNYANNGKSLHMNYYTIGNIVQELKECDNCVFDVQKLPVQVSVQLHSCTSDNRLQKKQVLTYLQHNNMIHMDSVKTQIELLELIPENTPLFVDHVQPNYIGVENIEKILSKTFGKKVIIKTDEKAMYFEVSKLLALKKMNESEAIPVLLQEHGLKAIQRKMEGWKYRIY